MKNLLNRLRGLAAALPHREDGMSTAEYAVGTLAAVAFAGLLMTVLTSDDVRGLLTGVVQRALQ